MIERLTEEHIPEVALIERLCFSEPWSEKSLGILTQKNAVGFVALESGRMAAYGGMICVLDEGQITNIAAHPDLRRKGYGEAVTRALINYGKENGLIAIYLEVRRSNGAARALYSKLGFEEIGERKGFYRNPCEDAVLMKITL